MFASVTVFDEVIETDIDKTMDDLTAFFNDGDESHFDDWGETKTPNQKIHGEIIKRRCIAFYDVFIYEDGFEEYFYIGD